MADITLNSKVVSRWSYRGWVRRRRDSVHSLFRIQIINTVINRSLPGDDLRPDPILRQLTAPALLWTRLTSAVDIVRLGYLSTTRHVRAARGQLCPVDDHQVRERRWPSVYTPPLIVVRPSVGLGMLPCLASAILGATMEWPLLSAGRHDAAAVKNGRCPGRGCNGSWHDEGLADKWVCSMP